MCGIAGYLQLEGQREPDRDLLVRMISVIRHRGPDEFGAYLDNKCALGHARLSIIDLSTGQQPLCNEDETIWIVFNGEIFNYVELRPVLEQHGHRFRTHSDTEVIVHAYEQWGSDCVQQFNGQFAFAIYDTRKQSLFLARDRMGKRPLFYTTQQGRFYFASEIKALFCDPSIERRLDPQGLDQIFTWWTTAPPRTAFAGISELESGCSLEITSAGMKPRRYWAMEYPEHYDEKRSVESWAEELHALLIDSVRLRLRADVPVGAYLSGGLDSSAIAALVREFTTNRLESFSIAFGDAAFDESEYQKQMATQLGTSHHSVQCNYRDIAQHFPDVIWHTERPILRTAPTPMYLLSRLVNQTGFKVVLTGEGSDEIFAGYDIFKETKIRAWWSRHPDSSWRPLLLQRLYPTLPLSEVRSSYFLQEFYREGLAETDKYYFSHMPRMKTTSRIKDFYLPINKAQAAEWSAEDAFAHTLPGAFARWPMLSRAQYLEAKSLLSGYLLSSQGDRMAAANAVEGRYPFLDHRVIELAARIPPRHKMFGLKEKWILKKAMKGSLPPAILQRPKQPYMAPDAKSFTQSEAPEYVRELLSPQRLNEVGVFNPTMAGKLYEKCRKQAGAQISFKDNMAFVGILSTQILADRFIHNFDAHQTPRVSEFRVWREASRQDSPKS